MQTRCTPEKIERLERSKQATVREPFLRQLDADRHGKRRATVEHAFGALKAWMDSTPFPTKGLEGTSTEMSVACNVKRRFRLFGAISLFDAIRA